MKTPSEIAHHMLANDAYSQRLGISIESIEEGYCSLSCTVTSEMTNGFGIAHGGITYALADSALAFCSNGYGQQCVSIETQISHIQKVQLNDQLIARCKVINRGKTIARFSVAVYNQHKALVADFKGTVFCTEKTWDF